MRNWLIRFSAFGGQVANFVTLLTTAWGIVLSTVLAALTLSFTQILALANRNDVRTAGTVFLFSLWTYIGLSNIFRRGKPVLTTRVADLSYGLSLDGISPIFNPENECVLQMALNLKNYSGKPLKYNFSKFDVLVKRRHVGLDLDASTSGILPFGAGVLFMSQAYKNNEINDLLREKVSGSVSIIIEYGIVNEFYSRKLEIDYKIEIDFSKTPALGFNAMVKRYDENAIEGKH